MTMNHGLNIKSDRSDVKAFVLFENTTNRMVDVYWVDYTSQLVHYRTLKPKEFLMMTTFQTHPWIFFDRFTGERMVVNNEDVYWPTPWYLKIDPRQRTIKRALAKIHFPMRSLKTNAMWTVVRRLQNSSDIEQLEIPRELESELKTLYEGYIRHYHSRAALSTRDRDNEEESGRNTSDDSES